MGTRGGFLPAIAKWGVGITETTNRGKTSHLYAQILGARQLLRAVV
jgi:hypothetical protein